jgi:hypothetical protein
MLDADALANLEGDAVAFHRFARSEPDDPEDLNTLCKRTVGSYPQRVRMVGRGDLHPGIRGQPWTLRVHRALPPELARFVVAHELAHWWFLHTGWRAPSHAHLEAACNALGAAILAPRPCFMTALRDVGRSRVHRLAKTFHTTQACALLRLGETTGRPVVLVRPSAPIVRGECFAWPSDLAELERAVRQPPAGVHPIVVDGRMGLMAA